MMHDTKRTNLHNFKLSDHPGNRVEVYSRKDQFGEGPCASVYLDDQEVMRFDLFNPGHMHFAVLHAPRLKFPEGTQRDHIERGVRILAEHHRLAELLLGITVDPSVWERLVLAIPQIGSALLERITDGS